MLSKNSKENKKANVSENLRVLPSYLFPFVVEQKYDDYTARDHAVWRFIMRQARELFKQSAHSIYLDGLAKTGIPISRIPNIEEMNKTLQKFSWGAVCVRGFIPPQIFLEFFAHRVLPIAADMRSIEHIAYTPAPDIVHEAAGHAPIIADPSYAEFLEVFGKIATKAIYSDEDIHLYEAIRVLSDLKENSDSSEKEILKAEKNLKKTSDSITWDSEASKLSRLFWWTAEYGLVDSKSGPKIYGAGILSSLSEGENCLIDKKVSKVPFGQDSTLQAFDITKPQPQLFVAKNFDHLKEVLEEFRDSLSYKKGGQEALLLALKSKSLTTTVFDTGFSVSGVLIKMEKREDGSVSLKWKAPIQLCCGGCLGKQSEIKKLETVHVIYSSKSLDNIKEKESADKYIKGKVTSVYGGVCDRENFREMEQEVSASSPTRTSPFTDKEKKLFSFYKRVRSLRNSCEDKKISENLIQNSLKAIVFDLKEKKINEWLLWLELAEIIEQFLDSKSDENKNLEKEIKVNLQGTSDSLQNKTFITRGLGLASYHDNDPLRQDLF